ncbi:MULTISPECIES: DEAD/DEAH box helicase [Bacillus cereus group]|uniref:DEAD/DEAH box helicase n=1 Tax=Bacillus cereus group TaxID=86661 RepID=UPI0020B6E834|nr:AAA family ATPase [Bacillus cereus group sp. BY9-3LC]MDA1780823.1 AAA family ATPase [Bacillus cereus group sp. BY9-3LC]UTG83306.1 AAA family ATPase [Bacillus paranthracis]
MSSTYFFSDIEINDTNKLFIDSVEAYAEENALPTYVIHSPLAEKKYTYSFSSGMIVLIPNHKIIIVNNRGNEDDFEEYFEDFFEDLGHLSDRYEYRKILGRPRKWKNELLADTNLSNSDQTTKELLAQFKIEDKAKSRQIELLISLCIGSINHIDKITEELPETTLEKVKQNVILFDGDQTRFIFKKKNDDRITIQGLAGTGKTELLLHKVKELYTENGENRIAFTCFNKALANSLKSRVPLFFDFMKVEEQIKWEERLWIMHSWGSKNDPNNVGMYSLICKKYGIPFQGLRQGSFDSACREAINFLRNLKYDIEPMFDYVLIDESQDFQESFFELCEMVTSNTVYVAGDIFQNIFQPNTSDSKTDFLLNKCYRTDPRTLMFAHGVGFGLFEEKGIRKLTNEQWEACGYNVEKATEDEMILTREPLRKFTDLDYGEIESIKLVEYDNDEFGNKLIETIEVIREQNPTVGPDDIAIVVIDKGNKYFDLMGSIGVHVGTHFDWKVNTLYNSKSLKKNTLSISNINNIKGLEFPFVICVSHESIGENVQKRNSLYMTLTRSFITSYLFVSKKNNESFINTVSEGLNIIKASNKLIFNKPKQYIDQAELTLDINDISVSQRDIVDEVFSEIANTMPHAKIYIQDPVKQDILRKIVYTIAPDSTNWNQIREIIHSNLINIGIK